MTRSWPSWIHDTSPVWAGGANAHSLIGPVWGNETSTGDSGDDPGDDPGVDDVDGVVDGAGS